MNERIQELAEQSEITQYVAAHNKYLERFAELLIRECIQSIQNESINPGGPGGWDPLESGLRIAENAIREHFGVLE